MKYNTRPESSHGGKLVTGEGTDHRGNNSG